MNISDEKILNIAKVCHEANKALCQTQGDITQTSWEALSEEDKHSTENGVRFCLRNPNASLAAIHENWMVRKTMDGWTYGTAKDVVKKQHPCIVPYDKLTFSEKAKDHLFKAIVNSLANC